MSKQRIVLAPNGVCATQRMQPFTPNRAQKRPDVKLSRLQQLLKSHRPKICLVRGEGLGDVIMTTPIITGLKNLFEKCDISYATNTTYLDGALVKVLQYNPHIVEIIERNFLDESNYDLVINLHCPAIHHEVPKCPPVHRIDLFSSHVGIKLTDKKPLYYILPEEVEAGRETLDHCYKNKLMMVQPFASNKRRSLEHKKLKNAIISLYRNFGIRSIIMTHQGDFFSDTIWDNIPGSMHFRNMNVREIAGIMVHCDLLLCPDSSLLHLAAALDVPTVGIFGPTDPKARVNLYPKATAICEANFAPCHCWFSACSIKEICWARITEEQIVETCINHLRSNTRVDILQLLERNKKVELETEFV